MAPLNYSLGLSVSLLVALKLTYCLERDLPTSRCGLALLGGVTVRE